MIKAVFLFFTILFSGAISKQERSRCHIVKIKSMAHSPKEMWIDRYDTVQRINETNSLHNSGRGWVFNAHY